MTLETEQSEGLDHAMTAVVGLTARVPDDAFTAEILGRERAGHGVIVSPDGVIATVGYLITEATEVWIKTADGRALPGHVLGFDQDSGIGLVQALTREALPFVKLGDSEAARPGADVIVAGSSSGGGGSGASRGGGKQVVAASVVGRREFAGYWEYVLDEAIFTAPAHQNWGGTAVLNPSGDLLGIGSLHVGHRGEDGATLDLNMVIPINLIKPVLKDIIAYGAPRRPVRPWLGIYASDEDGHITIMGSSTRGPASRAGVRRGDIVHAVGATPVTTLTEFFRAVWAQGDAGADVPLVIERPQGRLTVTVTSGDRRTFLKGPVVH